MAQQNWATLPCNQLRDKICGVKLLFPSPERLSMVSFNRQEGVLREQVARLEAQVHALQAVEDRTSIALAQSNVGIFDWDLEHRRIYLSPVLHSMLGYEDEEVPEDLTLWLSHVDDSDRFRAEKELRDALMYGKERHEGLYQMHRRDGTPCRLLFRGIIFRKPRVEGGDATRVLGTAIDVTKFSTGPDDTHDLRLSGWQLSAQQRRGIAKSMA
jgi:PAS domain-containing protein